VGLDRGQLGASRVVRFTRIGPKVLLIQPNLDYRAVSQNATERRAVAESFAQSALWGAEVAAQSDGAVLLDATSFLIRDAHDVVGALKRSDQGTYRLDSSRSAVYLPRSKAFADNTELEALLTFETSDRPGRLVSETAPSANAITLRQHHSFIRLPDSEYRPRRHDPRAGTISGSFADYATPLDQPLVQRFIRRHRLEKQNPSAAMSEAVEPIVYYVDPGAPAQIQQALIEGASWWNQAFEAAGFRNAFRVEVLPEEADPLDVRYNVIQWVHRSTRGWSYGASVSDPRTGEILKGHVSLGSLRVRQDRLLFEGLDPVFASSEQASGICLAGLAPAMEYLAQAAPDTTPVDLSLARIRQLSAHEVGHTLGFAHNFAASTYAGRASVMDYPAPLAKPRAGGGLDLSDAYATGIGEWDKVTVRYAYSHFPEGSNEEEQLEAILQEAIGKGYLFISDADARPPGAAHPLANLWDNGAEPVEGLRNAMRVRRIALQGFGQANLAPGRPLALLQDTLVALYLHHRYQVEAASKVPGGAYFTYALRGDGQKGVEWVDPADQRSAVSALLDTLAPEELVLPASLLESLPPLPLGYFDERERFKGHTGRLFDPLGAARIAADMTLGGLLQSQRAARLETLHALDARNPDLGEVIDLIFSRTWQAARQTDSWKAAVARVVEGAALDRLIRLAGNPGAASRVRAAATAKLREWRDFFSQRRDGEAPADIAHRNLALDDVQRFLTRPAQVATGSRDLTAPPGMPIGSGKPPN
ncbi:MAG: zinc-dependent metalloprotease, partial [Acidobacteriota bacterium]